MSGATGIEWTDATWNPIRGCSRVSEGCRNCYAEKVAYRFSDEGAAYHGLVGIGGKWNGHIHFIEEHLLDPLRWHPAWRLDPDGAKVGTRPRRIFVNSMSDLFHENLDDRDRTLIFAVMLLCPQHEFQVLTKRADRMLEYLNAPGRRSEILAAACRLAFDLQSETKYARIPVPSNATDVVYDCGPNRDEAGCRVRDTWPLPNVWLGVSVENQKAADERIPLLLATPAAKRFISAEPLLEPVELKRYVWLHDDVRSDMPWLIGRLCAPTGLHQAFRNPLGAVSVRVQEKMLGIKPNEMEARELDWVICGGESGPGARPMHPDWARGLRDQCAAAGVPFFFKQWGEWIPWQMDGGPSEWKSQAGKLIDRHAFPDFKDPRVKGWTDDLLYAGDDIAVHQRVGKKIAGHLLDGVEWHQFPEAVHAAEGVPLG